MEHIYYQPQFAINWFDYQDLYKFVVEYFPSGSTFVEVGSFQGKSASFLAVEIANSGKQIKLDLVDSWSGPFAEHKPIFEQNIIPVRHLINSIIWNTSVEAAKHYQDYSLDFVFIDADHSYQAVIDDLKAWTPKVKRGGLIAGDDYAWDEVYRAVQDTFGPGNYTDPWHQDRTDQERGRFMVWKTW